MLLGIFPHEIGEKKSLFHIGTGADIRLYRPQNTVGKPLPLILAGALVL